MAKILVIDDEPQLRRIVGMLLREHGHEVEEASAGEAGIDIAASQLFDVVLLDFSLPGVNGLQVLERLRDRDPSQIIVLMTAYGSIRSAVDAMRAGAFDYITKPFDNDELLVTISRGLSIKRLSAEVEALRSELESRYGFSDIVGVSSSMREVFRVMSRVAPSDVTVLVLGESGTGKELVARGVHRTSPRSSGPFVAVNCSAIPVTLVESEFFGYERGAFTDAKESRPGKFEQAHHGTLFLDEVGDLPLDAQAKLLRVLQDKHVTRLGSQRAIPINVRVIAATNKNLEDAVTKGDFREDLFWRLNVVSLRLPPLRERIEDLGLLIDHLLEQLASELGRQSVRLSGEARRLLLAYHWPGNVRELENALRRALVLADDATIRASDLPARIDGGVHRPNSDEGKTTLADAASRAVERVERALIQATLIDTNGNRTAAAQSLGINRKTLFNKMKTYGLTTEDREFAEEE